MQFRKFIKYKFNMVFYFIIILQTAGVQQVFNWVVDK